MSDPGHRRLRTRCSLDRAGDGGRYEGSRGEHRARMFRCRDCPDQRSLVRLLRVPIASHQVTLLSRSCVSARRDSKSTRMRAGCPPCGGVSGISVCCSSVSWSWERRRARLFASSSAICKCPKCVAPHPMLPQVPQLRFLHLWSCMEAIVRHLRTVFWAAAWDQWLPSRSSSLAGISFPGPARTFGPPSLLSCICSAPIYWRNLSISRHFLRICRLRRARPRGLLECCRFASSKYSFPVIDAACFPPPSFRSMMALPPLCFRKGASLGVCVTAR